MHGCLRKLIALFFAIAAGLIAAQIFDAAINSLPKPVIPTMVIPTVVFTQQKTIIYPTNTSLPKDALIAAPITAVALNDANLRAGPSLSDTIVGTVNAGETLTIVGESATGDWYQLDSHAWIAAFLVDKK